MNYLHAFTTGYSPTRLYPNNLHAGTERRCLVERGGGAPVVNRHVFSKEDVLREIDLIMWPKDCRELITLDSRDSM
jgi:hypothetical protein